MTVLLLKSSVIAIWQNNIVAQFKKSFYWFYDKLSIYVKTTKTFIKIH